MDMYSNLNNKQQSIIDQEFNKPENNVLRFGSLLMLALIVVLAIGLSAVKVEKREKVKVVVERIGDFSFRILDGDNKYQLLKKNGDSVSSGTPLIRWVNHYGVDSIITAPGPGKFSAESFVTVKGEQKFSQIFIRVGAYKPGFKVRVLMSKEVYQKDLSGTKMNFSVSQQGELSSHPLKAVLILREDYIAFSNEQIWVADLDENSQILLSKYGWKSNEVSGEGTVVSGTQQLLMQLLSKK